MKLYHVTKKDLVPKILKEGLKINQPFGKSAGSQEYVYDIYGLVPIYLSLKPNKYTNGVLLEVDIDASNLVADVPSLLDHEGILDLDKNVIWWEEYFEDPKYNLILDLIDENGEVGIDELTKISKKTMLAIKITETCVSLTNIAPENIKIIGETSKKTLSESINSLYLLLEEIDNPGFSWAEFKKLPDLEQKKLYLQANLEYGGEGSSRIVFLLKNLPYVLKLAKNQKGVAQNQGEVEVYTNPKTKRIVAKIADMGDDYAWIVSELARGISYVEFRKDLGIQFTDFVDAIAEGAKTRNYQSPLNTILSGAPEKAINFYKMVVSLIVDNKILPGDLTKLDSYGKTNDGRIIVVDYGFTHENWQQVYDAEQQKLAAQEKLQQLQAQQGRLKGQEAASTTAPSPATEPMMRTAPRRPRAPINQAINESKKKDA